MSHHLYRLVFETSEDISELGRFLKNNINTSMDYERTDKKSGNHYFVTNGCGLIEFLHFLKEEHAGEIHFEIIGGRKKIRKLENSLAG
jgi:hypothetical protein